LGLQSLGVFAETKPATLELEANGYYYIPWQELGFAGITIVQRRVRAGARFALGLAAGAVRGPVVC
jgi:hypothetical protein